MKKLTVMGLNSGTSMDGIDAAIFEIEPQPGALVRARLIGASLVPFQPEFASGMRALIDRGECRLDEICRLNFALGEVFASAAEAALAACAMKAGDLDLIGSHGQTIWHAPGAADLWGVRSASTMQLGEPGVIAARLGVPVVADFRPQDMACGGQGAPLSAFADEVLFGPDRIATGVLNIGGIANITVVDETGTAAMAFDTGPGNMIIDRASRKLFSRDFDEGGRMALAGKPDREWLSALLSQPYFQASPPKTTGRELFGSAYADGLLAEAGRRGLSASDTQCTLTMFTALAIVEAYVMHVEAKVRLKRLVLGGGGAENAAIVKFLTDFWPHEIEVLRHEDFGISTKFKEALLFALLAYTTYFGVANNVPQCTGARERVCLGKICKPRGKPGFDRRGNGHNCI